MSEKTNLQENGVEAGFVLGRRLLTMKGLKIKVGLSRPSIYNLLKKELFPRPVSVPGIKAGVFWRETEVDEWISNLPYKVPND